MELSVATGELRWVWLNKGTSQPLIFPTQATEGIIKHLEKVDAEPEEDDFMKEDETTDFTLFEVIFHQSLLLIKSTRFIAIAVFQVSKDDSDTTLIDNSSENFASTTYNFDDWGKF